MQLSDKFEKAYSDYIDSEDYEDLLEEKDIFSRPAFIAGWDAAMRAMESGNPPPTKWGKGPAAFELYRREET